MPQSSKPCPMLDTKCDMPNPPAGFFFSLLYCSIDTFLSHLTRPPFALHQLMDLRAPSSTSVLPPLTKSLGDEERKGKERKGEKSPLKFILVTYRQCVRLRKKRKRKTKNRGGAISGVVLASEIGVKHLKGSRREEGKNSLENCHSYIPIYRLPKLLYLYQSM